MSDPKPEFFEAGRTYTDGNGFRAPELTAFFHAEHITRHPERGHLRAIGWARSGATGATWHGNFLDEGDFAGWTELEEPLLGAAPAVVRPRRTDEERRHWLLSVIRSERGQWTVGRVKRLYGRYCEGHVLRSTIRRELAALCAAGELEMHHESDRRYYTLAAGGGR
ncbi:hypothetical protein [Streptomyces sp. NBC_01233]|uniref:hypothetical protein n=1 Tax=Streptomyces sp. NBC_01233 TaxID=2903787 RepID=UPI002E0E392B|nr:hypothetical protein OG332_10510 [Streptomyces sp. NBC_01233]